MRIKTSLFAASAILAASSTPALAGVGDPIQLGNDTTLDVIANARLRYESVDQDGAANNADAVTARLRAGVELKNGIFTLLAEGEGTFAIVDDYNDTLPFNGLEPFPVVADPENLELNRLQVTFAQDGYAITVGRQRIILDNARFVGNVGWRQNEQTFDAVRLQGKIGPVTLDGTYSTSQRTIFGVDSPREDMDGNLILLNGGFAASVVDVKTFAYLLDYDGGQAFNSLPFSSQTYGVLAKANIPIAPDFTVNLEASYANQSDYKDNQADYNADYIAAKLGASVAGFALTAGYEEVGSDGGVAAFQTPLATLHAFQGWADVFLVTPVNGVRDYFGSVSKGFTLPALGKITASVTYHQFDSDFGGINYGSEWDASLGFKIGQVGILAKYANYNADGFSVDTEKFWLQAEYGF